MSWGVGCSLVLFFGPLCCLYIPVWKFDGVNTGTLNLHNVNNDDALCSPPNPGLETSLRTIVNCPWWFHFVVLYPSVLVSRDTGAKVTESKTIPETNVKFIIWLIGNDRKGKFLPINFRWLSSWSCFLFSSTLYLFGINFELLLLRH